MIKFQKVVWKNKKRYWHTVKCVIQYKQFRDEQHFEFFPLVCTTKNRWKNLKLNQANPIMLDALWDEELGWLVIKRITQRVFDKPIDPYHGDELCRGKYMGTYTNGRVSALKMRKVTGSNPSVPTNHIFFIFHVLLLLPEARLLSK